MSSINPIHSGLKVAADPGTELPAQLNGDVRRILSGNYAILTRLGMMMRGLPADQKALLQAKLRDPQDELRQQVEQVLSPEDLQRLDHALDESGPVDHNPFNRTIFDRDTLYALASRGELSDDELDAIDRDPDFRLSIDQWNHFKHEGSMFASSFDPVSVRQTDAMIAASGHDRSQPVSIREYLGLYQQTTRVYFGGALGEITDDDFERAQTELGDGLHTLAVRGNRDALDLDPAQFNIDQWNDIRTKGFPPEIEPLPPLTGAQTDALLAASGKNRDTPMTAREYRALLHQAVPGAKIDDPAWVDRSLGPAFDEGLRMVHSLAARGDADAMGLDVNTRFTIDQWSDLRTNGNPPRLAAVDPLSSTEVDAMIAASGRDRNAPITVKEYLALLEQAKASAPKERQSIDLESRIRAAQMRRDG